MPNEEKKAEASILDRIIIPQCCREGWATCKHVPKKQRKVKTNIGL